MVTNPTPLAYQAYIHVSQTGVGDSPPGSSRTYLQAKRKRTEPRYGHGPINRKKIMRGLDTNAFDVDCVQPTFFSVAYLYGVQIQYLTDTDCPVGVPNAGKSAVRLCPVRVSYADAKKAHKLGFVAGCITQHRQI